MKQTGQTAPGRCSRPGKTGRRDYTRQTELPRQKQPSGNPGCRSRKPLPANLVAWAEGRAGNRRRTGAKPEVGPGLGQRSSWGRDRGQVRKPGPGPGAKPEAGAELGQGPKLGPGPGAEPEAGTRTGGRAGSWGPDRGKAGNWARTGGRAGGSGRKAGKVKKNSGGRNSFRRNLHHTSNWLWYNLA